MNVDISMSQLISSLLLGCVAYITNSVRQELRGLRSDIKEERDARNALELKVEAIDSRCKERHRE